MIKYTFIIPYHNKLALLYRLLDTIPQRDDVEILIIDDNSDEGNHPECNRSDARVIFIDAEHTKGAGHARNVGLDNATGEWLLFPDSDDIYEKGFFEELDQARGEDIDIFYFDVYSSYSVETGNYSKIKYSKYLNQFLQNKNNMFWQKSMKHSLQVPWNFMIRSSYVSSINARFAETPTCNDAYFHHYTAMNTTRVDASPKKLYYWIVNPGSLTFKKRTPEQNKANVEQGRLMITMRMQAGAWNTIPSYFENIGYSLKNYGVLFTIRRYGRRLFNGIPWHKIWWHKLFDKKK